jgi:hypothetical protein
MRTVFVPFMNLSFNSGKLNSSGLVRADGVMHGGAGYLAPPPLFKPTSANFSAMAEAVTEPCFGHVNRAKSANGTYTIYFYGDGQLFRIDVSGDPPWTITACGTVTALAAGEGGFCSFGENEIFAAGHGNHVQIRRAGQANFEACFTSTDKPKAMHVGSIGMRMLFANIASTGSAGAPDPNRSLLWWGATDNARAVGNVDSLPKDNTDWQPLFDDYGDIVGLSNGKLRCSIFKSMAVYSMDLEGADGFFFDRIASDVGCIGPRSITELNDDDYFWSTLGPAVVRSSQIFLLGDGLWNERGLALESPPRPALTVLGSASDQKNGTIYWLVEYDGQDYAWADGNPPTETITASGKIYALIAYNSAANQFSFVWRQRSSSGISLVDEASPATSHLYRPICLVDRIPWKNQLPMDGIGLLAVESSATNPGGPREPTLFLAGLPSTSWTPEWTSGQDLVFQTGLVPISGPNVGAIRGVRPVVRPRRGHVRPAIECRIFSALTPWDVERVYGPYLSTTNLDGRRGYITTPGATTGSFLAVELTIKARTASPLAYSYLLDEIEGVELLVDDRRPQ